jgi:hypothetical protein
MKPFDYIVAQRGFVIVGEEAIEKRVSDSKTFAVGPNRFRLIKTFGPVHYDVGGKLEDIDLTPHSEGNEWVIDKAPYIVRINKQRPLAVYRSRATDKVTTFEHPGLLAGVFDVFWHRWLGVDTDVDVALHIRPGGAEVWVELLSAAADPIIRWTVNGVKPLTGLIGHDAKNRRAEIIDGAFTGRVSEIVDKETRQREWKTDVVYPVRIV